MSDIIVDGAYDDPKQTLAAKLLPQTKQQKQCLALRRRPCHDEAQNGLLSTTRLRSFQLQATRSFEVQDLYFVHCWPHVSKITCTLQRVIRFNEPLCWHQLVRIAVAFTTCYALLGCCDQWLWVYVAVVC
jgi:hypothetical protein